jgi:serine/threonine-protein kinase
MGGKPSGDGTENDDNVNVSDIRAQLDRILQSRSFRNAERLRRFLKFTVECALDGTVDQLKESVLGRKVFDRGSKYDPRLDSIVRVESQRLRKRLREYYELEGRNDFVSVIFQPGSYVPTFANLNPARLVNSDPGTDSPELRFLDPKTVAVLPFANLTADPKQEYLCDGITDEIIYALSRIPGLNMIGHTSVFALKGAAQDARKIGDRLGAGTIIDGSVRRSGSQLRIFAEVLDAATGKVTWAETYDRTLDALFSVEREIAEALARVLQVTVASPTLTRLIRRAPSMDAYLLYLQGLYEWNQMSGDGYRRAAEIFERAISLFPLYASPHAGLADAYSYLALWGYARPHDVLPRAQQSALEALRLDSSSAHAHTSLAAVTAFYEWRWEEGEHLARKATQLEPSYAFGQQIHGCSLFAQGEMEHASACFRRGVALDPLSVRAHRMLGWAMYLQGQRSDAEKWLQAALVLDREPMQTRYLLAQIYLSEKRYTSALEQAWLCQTNPPDPLGLGVLGACLARLNQRDEALQIVAMLARAAEGGYVDPNAMAQVQIALDDTDAAIESVKRILDERSPFAYFLKFDPEFDPLRSDPRFAELISPLG